MKFLEHNWTWIVMVIVPLWITTINMSRDILMAVSIPTNGLMVKKQYDSRMLKGGFFADVPARTEKNP